MNLPADDARCEGKVNRKPCKDREQCARYLQIARDRIAAPHWAPQMLNCYAFGKPTLFLREDAAT